jgi:hypothetical protein
MNIERWEFQKILKEIAESTKTGDSCLEKRPPEFSSVQIEARRSMTENNAHREISAD